MFEKEAEEAFNEWKSEQYKDQSTEEKMEFVEHLHYFQKHFEKTFKAGYNKANEWHFVKDELPKENQLVLIYRENSIGANIALAYWYKSYVNDKVIAWKEIVLPELKESE